MVGKRHAVCSRSVRDARSRYGAVCLSHTDLCVEAIAWLTAAEGTRRLFYLETRPCVRTIWSRHVFTCTLYSSTCLRGSGLTLGVSVSFFVSVVNSQVYTVYKYIYLFSLYAYIQYYFCTDLYGQMDLFFFSTKGAIITEAFSHTFLHDLLKKNNFLNWSVISTLLLLLLELQSKHCNFVIPTCELWNKQGGLKFGLLSCRLIFLLIYSFTKSTKRRHANEKRKQKNLRYAVKIWSR